MKNILKKFNNSAYTALGFFAMKKPLALKK